MDREEKDIFDFMNKLSEEESIRLIEKIDVNQYQLSEVQTQRIKDNVFAKIADTTCITGTMSTTSITSTMNTMNTTRKKRFLSKKYLLAAGLIVVLIFGVLTPMGQRTLADIIKKIYYLPGSGAVEEDKQDSIFALSQSIRIKYKGSEITVHSIIKNTESMTVKMSGGAESDSKDDDKDVIIDKHAFLAHSNMIEKLILVDEKGIKYTSSSSSVGGGYGWVGMYYFNNLPKNFIHFKIIVSDDMLIPINLKKVESHKDYLSIGPTDMKNDLGLTLVPVKDGEKIRFELIEHPSMNRNVELYGDEDNGGYGHVNFIVKDNDGGVYPVEHLQSYMGTLSEFYFKASNKYQDYSVEIPQVRMHYKIDQEIHLDIPKAGETKINKILSINGFQFRIDNIYRQSNKIRVYVDNYYIENKPENLSRFNLNIKTDSKGQAKGYSWKYDDNIIAHYYEFEVAPEDSEIQIKFTDMYTILKGPWKFNFTVK